MKRMRIVGLCLIAVFAVSALGAASASASFPEYKSCVKAAVKEKGTFNDKNCSIPSLGKIKAKEGGYELGSWEGLKKKGFKGKNGVSTLLSYIPNNEATFWTGGEVVGTVSCKSAKSEGEITGPKTSTVTVEFKTCASAGKKCASAGEKAGTIKTKLLHAELGFIEGGVGSLIQANDTTGGAGVPNQAEFNCEGTAITTNGSLIGVNTGNIDKFSKEGTQTFATNAENGQEVPFGAFPNESEGVWGPGTGAVHILKTFANPPGVSIPSGQKTTSVLKGENAEIATH
jgi:hypothetical protein